MIYINYKVLIVTGLIIFSFINNILLGFENLRSINEETEVECFFVNVNPQISLEKPIVSHLKVIYKYTIFYFSNMIHISSGRTSPVFPVFQSESHSPGQSGSP